MALAFFAGFVIGTAIAAIVFVAAYMDLLKDVRREEELLRETRERLAIKEARLV